MANLKLTFVPAYATANTVRFDEVNDMGFLGKPMIGAIYIDQTKLPELNLNLVPGEMYSEFGQNGKEYKRQRVTGEGFTVTISKA